MTGDKLTLLQRIKKLLALSSSPNEHEAALALERANELLTKHGLSMLDVADADRDPVGEEGVTLGSTEKWRATLLSILAKANYCHILLAADWTPTGRKSYRTAHLIGRPENTTVVRALYEWILPQVARIATSAVADKRAQIGDSYWDRYLFHPKIYKQEFCAGIVVRIKERLDEMRAAQERATAHDAHSVTALVKVEGTAIQRYMDAHYPKRGSARFNARTQGSGFRAGYAAGNNVSLSRHVVRSGAPALASGR